MKRCNIVGKAN